MQQGDFTNLPGTFEQMQDGNLTVTPVNNNPVVTVIGTASQGNSDEIYQVGSVSAAAQAYGLDGTLIRGLYEASVGGGLNFQLYRMGATDSLLVTNFGLTIETIEEDSSAGGDYVLLWDDSALRLKIWNINTETLVYDNDPADEASRVDIGEVSVTGTAVSNGGTDFGADPTLTTSGIMALSGFASTSGFTFTAGTDGLNLSRMQTYEALYKAYSLLEDQISDVVIPMNVYVDDLNVMDMSQATVSGLALTALSNYPTQGSTKDVLGKVYVQNYNGRDYFWWFFPANPAVPVFTGAQIYPTVGSASATKDADGKTLTTADFHEVNFGYQLAQFCYSQSQVNQDMTGTIGMLPPNSFGLKDVAKWVGSMPTVSTQSNANGIVTANGTGLLGNKFMSGRVTLNGIPGFIVDGIDGFFNGGFIATDSGWLDGSQQSDNNGHRIDIGKYISVVPTYPVLANSSSPVSYTANGAATYGGFYSVLPVSQAPTNQLLNNMRLPFRINTGKLDLLAGQRYVTFHQKTRGIVVSDTPTAARKDSDYNRLSTVRQVKAAVDALRRAADPFLGQGISGASTAALDTAIDNALGKQVKSNNIVRYQYQTLITPQMKVLGQAIVQLKLVPAFELRQITVLVALAAV